MRLKHYLILVVSALIIFAFSFWAYFSFTKYQGEHAQKRENISAYQAQTSEQYPDICLKEGTSFIRLLKCLINTVDANRNAQRTQYNLEAQQEMAEWAYLIILVTLGGLGTSIIGLILLWQNLEQVQRSNETAKISADAALRAREEMIPTFGMPIRVYVVATWIGIDPNSVSFAASEYWLKGVRESESAVSGIPMNKNGTIYLEATLLGTQIQGSRPRKKQEA